MYVFMFLLFATNYIAGLRCDGVFDLLANLSSDCVSGGAVRFPGNSARWLVEFLVFM